MISLRTNVDSINAQANLKTNSAFQSNTIRQLTSGYRINASGDDAAGLAIANSYRSKITELNQGVSNANDGVSQLQIVDGGLNNISTILDRMKTLATQSASQTFSGNRAVLNQEYTGLLKEVDRQAANINLNLGGSLNKSLNVYIGGANTAANSNVALDLSGKSNAVDSASLNLSNTTIQGGGTGMSGNAMDLAAADAAGQKFLKGTAGDTETFAFGTAGTSTPVTVTLTGSTNGRSLSAVLSDINTQLSANTATAGITAGLDAGGQLQFTSSTAAFTVKDVSSASITNSLTDYTAAMAATGYVANSAGLASNAANYSITVGSAAAGATVTGTTAADVDTLTFTTASGSSVNVVLNAANSDTLAHKITAFNTATASYGITAMADAAGTGISFQSTTAFTLKDAQGVGESGKGLFATNSTVAGGIGPITTSATEPPIDSSGTAAIAAINNAIQSLGLVQGTVGSSQNKLQYAINLATSQITNFSTAESQIRDADVAMQASNLTKTQVLQQTSIAAMAQANTEAQSVMKLLQ